MQEHARNFFAYLKNERGLSKRTLTAYQRDVDQLLSHRFNEGLPTVIVSIVPVTELDERLQSRLIDSDISRIIVTEENAASLYIYNWAPQYKLEKEMTFVYDALKKRKFKHGCKQCSSCHGCR